MIRLKEVSDKVFAQIRREQIEKPLRGAVGLIEATENEKPVNYLLYNTRKSGRSRITRDITGAATGTDLVEDREEYAIVEGFTPVSRDSRVGKEILANRHGEFELNTRNGAVLVKLGPVISYSKKYARIDAFDGSYNWDEDQSAEFVSLNMLLEQEGLSEQREKLKNKITAETEESELNKLRAALDKLNQTQLSEREQQRKYIRTTNQLRNQFLLDKIQDDVRRKRILNGALIIDGGPGTGKTTTLIQRITFLTNTAHIEEYRPDLGTKEIEELEQSWVFISPSALLKAFLKDNMSNEGLQTDQEHLVVWDDYLSRIFREYGLIEREDSPGFKLSPELTHFMFTNSTTSLNTAKKHIDRALTEDIKRPVNRSLKMNVKGVEWELLGKEVQVELEKLSNVKNLMQAVSGIHNLKARYSNRVAEKLSDLPSELKNVTDRLQFRLSSTNPELHTELALFLKDEFDKRQLKEQRDASEIIEEDEEEDELTIAKEFVEIKEVNRFLNSLVQAASLMKLRRGFSPSKRFRPWIDRLEETLNIFDLESLGEKVFLRRFWAGAFRDGAAYPLKRIVQVYKNSRISLAEQLGHADEQLIKAIRKDNSIIYQDEKNFIIWYINKLLGGLYENRKAIYKSITHIFKSSYETSKKCVIAIDEATDFSIVELAAMASLADVRYKSVTLSGDLMQSMHQRGINSWNETLKLLQTEDIYRLRKSYRQTATLVNVAGRLYENVNGVTPDFISNLPKSELEPTPFLEQTSDDTATIDWLKERILDIYEQYDNKVPSTAIFAHSDSEVDKLTRLLNECDDLIYADIKVKGCRSDGELRNNDRVVVYNIKSIKGLEFEAVFFPNLDLIETNDISLLQRFLYVGVSRAAYYLGISYKNQLPGELDFIKQQQ